MSNNVQQNTAERTLCTTLEGIYESLREGTVDWDNTSGRSWSTLYGETFYNSNRKAKVSDGTLGKNCIHDI